jgi:DNA primase
VARIPDEIIHRIRDHADVVELVGRTVSLKRAGRSYKGLCPFHDEKTPSFNVNPDRGTYYCFGCQEGGDAFSFLMKIEGLTFMEAARSLARDAGIEIPEARPGEREQAGLAERLFDANALLDRHYRDELAREGSPGARYIAGRGLPEGAVETFGIGWAPDSWDFAVGVLRKAGVSGEMGQKAGLLSERRSGGHYDLLRGRVIFPIQDVRGRVVAFGGRAVSEGQEPKYLNTPETPIFRKREAFYGFPHALDAIRKRDRAVVSEGYFDRIALHLAGIEEAVATCGTSLTEDHARNLRRRTRNVVLLFDGDAAGIKAIWRSLEVLVPAGLRVRAAILPGGDDPDSFLQREGAEALCALVDQARPAMELAIEHAVSKGCDTPWAKADAVAEVAPLLALVPSGVERSEHCARLAMAVGTDVSHVEAAVRAAAKGEDARDAVPTAPRKSGPEDRNLSTLARVLVDHPALAIRVSEAELRELVPPGPHAELSLAIVGQAAQGPVDLDTLRQSLSKEARSALSAFTMQEENLEEPAAARAIDDVLRWFRKQQKRARQRALTQQLRESGADPAAVLEKKKQLLDEPPSQSAGMGTAV